MYSGTQSLAGISGEWITLKLPYKINLKSVAIAPRSGNTLSQRSAGSGVILGSNDEVNWDQLHSFSDLTATDYEFTNINNIIAPGYYKTIAIVVTELVGKPPTINITSLNISEIKFFGTREQGQSVLHDGQLTLTKSLTVPRIGPALDADDTPRRDRLVVEYNTSTNPTFEGVVRDTSGRGLDGVFVGGASYDATEKALKFTASSNQYVNTNIPLPADGNFIHSMSMWFNPTSLTASPGDAIVFIGDNTDNNKIEIFMETDRINYLFGGNNYEATLSLTNGRWYHLAVTYNGNVGASGREIYIDGVQRSASHSGLSELLNLTNGNLDLGRYTPSGSSSAYAFDGSISNFKLYDCALTAEEVKTLYDMGRCDEGHHVVNFSKTRVGIGLGDGEAPRGVLDVRGDLYLSGNIIRNTSSAKSGGVWLPTYQFEVGGATFVEDQRRGYYHIINNVLTAVYRARVVSNSGAGTLRPSLPGGHQVAGVVSGSTVAIGWWARNGDFGTANVGPYMLSDTTNGYIQPFHPGQINNQVRLDQSSLEADTYWTMFLSYPVE